MTWYVYIVYHHSVAMDIGPPLTVGVRPGTVLAWTNGQHLIGLVCQAWKISKFI